MLALWIVLGILALVGVISCIPVGSRRFMMQTARRSLRGWDR